MTDGISTTYSLSFSLTHLILFLLSNYPSLSPSATFTITTIAGVGTGTYSGDNGQATAAGLFNPQGIRVDASGAELHIYLLIYF